MLKTAEEIIRTFADILDDKSNVPVPPISKTDGLTPIDEEKPLSSRDVPEDFTPEWKAEHDTQSFLMGTKKPFRGYIRQPQYKELVKKTMDNLVKSSPSDYFSWGLNRREELKPWLYTAAMSLIAQDPYTALLKDITKMKELTALKPVLWKAVMDKITGSDPKPTGKIMTGDVISLMKTLSGQIATTDPEFYTTYIKGKPELTSGSFDEAAKRVEKTKLELGLSKRTKQPKTHF